MSLDLKYSPEIVKAIERHNHDFNTIMATFIEQRARELYALDLDKIAKEADNAKKEAKKYIDDLQDKKNDLEREIRKLQELKQVQKDLANGKSVALVKKITNYRIGLKQSNFYIAVNKSNDELNTYINHFNNENICHHDYDCSCSESTKLVLYSIDGLFDF